MNRRFWLESHSGTIYDLNERASLLHFFSPLGKSREVSAIKIGNWLKVTDDTENFSAGKLEAEIAFLEDSYTNLNSFLNFYHQDVRLSDNIEQRLKLHYQPQDSNNSMYVYVDIVEREYSKITNGYQRIAITFILLSPWIQDTVFTLDNTIPIVDGTPYPYTYEMTYGDYGIDGELDEVFDNNGDDEAVYTIQIIGPTTDPTFTIGKRTVAFQSVLEEGDQIYVNATPNASTIERNGVYNDQIFNPLNSSPWFTVPRGLIPIQIRAAGGKFVLTMKKVILDARKI